MPWSTPATFTPNAIAQASWMNTYVRDNLLHLYSPPTVELSSSTAYATTAGSYVDVDAALEVSITSTGGRLLVIARLHANPTFTAARILLDGVEFGYPNSTLGNGMTFARWTSVLAAGVHTLKPQWYGAGGATMTGYYIAVREVS